MKTKKFRKLRVNKETIVHLNVGAMRNLKGGGDTDFCPTDTCNTCALCDDTANCPLTGGGSIQPWCTVLC